MLMSDPLSPAGNPGLILIINSSWPGQLLDFQDFRESSTPDPIAEDSCLVSGSLINIFNNETELFFMHLQMIISAPVATAPYCTFPFFCRELVSLKVPSGQIGSA
jgi:hypothetical protein